jgi:glycosyltransferase involved in cell wall biosynthesis
MSGSPAQLPTVALVVDVLFPYHLGGREIRYHELAKRMTGKFSVHVFTMNWWQGARTRQDAGITLHAISRLHPMYSNGKRSTRQALFFALGCVRLLGHHFDVVDADHIPYFQILVLRLIASLKRKRLVVTWHEVWGPAYWREYLGPRAGSAAWFIELLAMRLPDHIVAASPETEQRLRSILGPKASVSIAPNGVDLEAVAETSPASAETDLIAVGRLIEHKRIDMLLEAVALLRARGVIATCRIVGDGPDRDALHRQARALGVSDIVEFWHDVREQKELYALVKAAKVAVFPSEREGFGAALLEALACGVPVVTTSAPDNLGRHLAERSVRGYVCPPTADALADKLASVLRDRQATAGLEDTWLAEYSWDALAVKITEALLPTS